MTMSEFEILRDYRQAKDKKEQVKILADMNMCTQKEMKAYLEQHGVNAKARNTWTDETVRKFQKLFHEGLSDNELADAMSLKVSTIYTMRIKYGLKRNKKRKPVYTDLLKSSI